MYSMQTLEIKGYYDRALRRGWWGKARSIITGEPRKLDELYQIGSSTMRNRYSEPGITTVQIDQIRGSEGRGRDFDRDFYPRQTRTRHRWQAAARLQLEGRNMPPVDLVQVGDRYFVRDGHHRVSVARSLGRPEIEAKVTVWQVEGALPWEQPEEQKHPVRRLASAIKMLVVQAVSAMDGIRQPALQVACLPEPSGGAD